MSELPTCPRCDRPIHDMAYVCGSCANGLARELADVAKVAGDVTLTIAKLTNAHRVTSAQTPEVDDGWYKGAAALYPHPLPVDLDAARRHDAAVGELTTWARHVAEQRGIPITRQFAVTTKGVVTQSHPLLIAAIWLARHLDWLRYRPEAEEAWHAITGACRQIVNVIDRHEVGELVGPCACGTALYDNRGTVRCTRCGTTYTAETVQAVRAHYRTTLEGAHLTASDAARWVADMGFVTDTTKLRKLIWAWAERGHLEPVDDTPRYRFGDVLARVMASPALRVA